MNINNVFLNYQIKPNKCRDLSFSGKKSHPNSDKHIEKTEDQSITKMTADQKETLELVKLWITECNKPEEVVEFIKKDMGENNPFIAQEIKKFARLYYSNGRLDDSISLYQSAIEIQEQRAASKKPSKLLIQLYEDISKIYEQKARNNDSSSIYCLKKADETCSKAINYHNSEPDTFTNLHNRAGLNIRSANLKIKLGENEAAEEKFLTALKDLLKSKELGHITTRSMVQSQIKNVIQNLENLYNMQNQAEKAESLKRKVEEGCL